MAWLINWPGGEPPAGADPAQVSLSEAYADATMTALTLGRADGQDAVGAHAAGVLALEFYKLVSNDRKGCRLPAGVQNISRQGVNMTIREDMFDKGRTLVPEVDAYLALFNPHGLRQRPRVYSIDRPLLPVVRRSGW